MLAVLVGMALFVSGMFFRDRAWYCAISGFFLIGAASLYFSFAVRCPACPGQLGSMIYASGNWLRISRKVRFCTYCGTDFDSELKL